MYKRTAILLVCLLLAGPTESAAVEHKTRDSFASIQRKLEIAEAKGDISQRRALLLRQKLNALVKQREAVNKGKAPAKVVASFHAELRDVDRELDREKSNRKVANTFWSNWF